MKITSALSFAALGSASSASARSSSTYSPYSRLPHVYACVRQDRVVYHAGIKSDGKSMLIALEEGPRLWDTDSWPRSTDQEVRVYVNREMPWFYLGFDGDTDDLSPLDPSVQECDLLGKQIFYLKNEGNHTQLNSCGTQRLTGICDRTASFLGFKQRSPRPGRITDLRKDDPTLARKNGPSSYKPNKGYRNLRGSSSVSIGHDCDVTASTQGVYTIGATLGAKNFEHTKVDDYGAGRMGDGDYYLVNATGIYPRSRQQMAYEECPGNPPQNTGVARACERPVKRQARLDAAAASSKPSGLFALVAIPLVALGYGVCHFSRENGEFCNDMTDKARDCEAATCASLRDCGDAIVAGALRNPVPCMRATGTVVGGAAACAATAVAGAAVATVGAVIGLCNTKPESIEEKPEEDPADGPVEDPEVGSVSNGDSDPEDGSVSQDSVRSEDEPDIEVGEPEVKVAPKEQEIGVVASTDQGERDSAKEGTNEGSSPPGYLASAWKYIFSS